MSNLKIWGLGLLGIVSVFLILLASKPNIPVHPIEHSENCCIPGKACTFRTVFGEESSDNHMRFKTPEKVNTSLNRGLSWLVTAQQKNGGWGAGSHSRQNVNDPHAVLADPATTSMTCMALLRSGSTLIRGTHSAQLSKGLEYLLGVVENTPANQATLAAPSGTQIQRKLGQNIDAVLTAQFLTNIIDHTFHNRDLHKRVENALNECVSKIQSQQQNDGSLNGAGWAGVLQSSLANNAVEAAKAKNAVVDDEKLMKSREYQKGNFDAETGKVETSRGAGIVLYSVSGSARAAAKDAREVKELVADAIMDGDISESTAVSPEVLEELGMDSDKAQRYSTSYKVFNAAKEQAQRKDVQTGYGSVGGEEFVSYLQTGESMIIGGDDSWTTWFNNISGRLLEIQNNDGSWNGHHCITSPVFCTATCVLILSISNDIDELTILGAK